MQYAVLGRTGLRVSRLGFGCMRLPMKSHNEVDRDQAIPLLRRAVELGVNYFDTAVMYCGGDSQRVLGEAMEGIREKVILSAKNHHHNKHDRDTWWRNLEDSLKFLRTDCIDVYSAHGLNYETFEAHYAGDDGLYKDLLRAKEQGLIRFICHSFHGSVESLMKMADTGLFDAVTVQYNLLDRSMEQGIAHAAERGEGVVIMGSVGGGRLGYPSERARELVGEVKSTPELALRFVLSNPHVTLALSGMSNLRMLEENAATVSNMGTLTQADHDRIEAAILERKELLGLYCTGCGYCMPCPEGVDIPANFEIMNLERVFGLTEHARSRYAALPGKAALCVLCGKCLDKCPQGLDIPTRLAEAVTMLDPRAGRVTGWTDLLGASDDPEDPDGLCLSMRYNLKNFTGTAASVRVDFESHGEEQIEPSRISVKSLGPYGRRHRKLTVRVRPPLDRLSLQAHMRVDGAESLEHHYYVAAAARRAEHYRLTPAARRGGTIHVPSPLHPLLAGGHDGKGHSFDFAVAYDDDHLYLWADVEDDLLRCTEGETNDNRDNLHVFLDGRPAEHVGLPVEWWRMTNLAVYPHADPGKAPEVRAHGMKSECRTELVRTGVGYRVDCAIPWQLFSRVQGVPAVIGFDVALTSHDADGKQVVRLSWTGRSEQERRAERLGRLLIVK